MASTTLATNRFPYFLLLIITTLITTTFSTPAQAETLSIATATRNQHSVVIYTATRKPHASVSPTRPPYEDLPLAIWAAANGVLSSYYPTSTPKQEATLRYPQTVVINGVTLEVNPSSMPTLTRSTARETPASTSEARPTPSSSATARDADGNGDRTVGIIIGVGISLIAFSLLGFIMWMLYRRKNTTGSFFKPVRYSLSSVMTEPAVIRGKLGGSSWMSPMGVRALEKVGRFEDDEACPAPTIRMSTVRTVEPSPADNSSGSFHSSRASVERLRTRRLVSRGMWTEVRPYELEGDEAMRAELSAESPTEKAASRKTKSSGTLREVSFADEGMATPRPRARSRPLVVTMSPTTSSSGIGESREGLGTSSSGRGESRDDITPIVAPMPSYRDRRPSDLVLPSATNRFRNQRLAPVHIPNERHSPGVSPLYLSPGISNSPSPNFRTNGFSPSPSPNQLERGVSPIVHYPSWGEVSAFEFVGRDSPQSHRSFNDGGDGWQAGGDTVFGRYEMG